MNNLFLIVFFVGILCFASFEKWISHQEKAKAVPMDTVALQKHLREQFCRECVERAVINGTPKPIADSTCKSLYIQ